MFFRTIKFAALAAPVLLPILQASAPAQDEKVVERVLVEGERQEAFDIEKFARAYFDAKTDLTRAAHIEDVTLERETGRIHILEGYVVMQEPVMGHPYNATFAGVGTIEMDCYAPIERRNLKKYWGKETLEDKFTRARFRFASDEIRAFFDGLDWQPIDEIEAGLGSDDKSSEEEDDKSDEEGKDEKNAWNDDALRARKAKSLFKSLLKDLRTNQENRAKNPPTQKAFQGWQTSENEVLMEEARKAFYGESYPGAWQVTLTRYAPGRKSDEVYVTGFEYSESPHGSGLGPEEFYLQLNTNFNNGYNQLACAWHHKDEYDENYLYTATSDAIDAEDNNEIRVRAARVEALLNDDRFDAKTHFTVEAIDEGVQMFAFELIPTLEVKSLKWIPKGSDESAAVPLKVYRPASPNFTDRWTGAVTTILPVALEKGEEADLVVEYEGKVIEQISSGFYVVTARFGWFPDRDLSNVRLDTTIWADPKRTVTATGNPRPCDPDQERPGLKCNRWVVEDPAVRLATFNVASDVKSDLIEPADVENLSVPVRSLAHNRISQPFCYTDQTGQPWCKDYNLSKSTEMIKGIAAFSVTLYEDKFGRYPYKKLDLVPWEISGAAQSPPSLITLPYNAFLTQTALNEMTTARQEAAARSGRPIRVQMPNPWTWREIISHEVSHQWWGHILYWNSYRDQWLSEGLADFSSAYFLEYDDAINKTEYHLKEWEERTRLLTLRDQAGETVGPVALGFRINSPLNPERMENWYSLKIYRKGAYTAQMLRAIFRALAYQQYGAEQAVNKGDELFFAMIKDFVESNRDGSVSNLMFQKTAEKHLGGANLGWFFNQWLYNDGIPRIRWAYEWVPKDDKYALKIRLVQENTDFQFPVTVSLRKGSGKKAQTSHFPMMVQSKDFTYETPAAFDRPWDGVLLNEDMMLLAEIEDPESSIATLAKK